MRGLIFSLTRHPIRVIPDSDMNDDEKISLKHKLRNYCLSLLEERLATVEKMVLNAQESAYNEGKGSAGDKHESGRAMGHLQKEMYEQQAVRLRHELLLASSTEIKLQPSVIKKGSVFISDGL